MTNSYQILIAGSADPSRTDYDPLVRDCNATQKAAEEIGVELAKAGCHLLVYSRDFIEMNVVHGFSSVENAPTESIYVRFPGGRNAAADFKEYQEHPKLFKFQGDVHPEWEASFYRSLRDADGVILIGGGQSVIITGHLALGYRIPLFALATFGGASHRIWKAIVPGRDLPSEEDKNIMMPPQWGPSSAAACVTSLLKQLKRRQQEVESAQQAQIARDRSILKRSISAVILFLLTVSTLALGLVIKNNNPWLFSVLLLFSGCPAGASGSTIRMLWADEATLLNPWRTTALGMVAGGISAILYLIPQLLSNPVLLEPDKSNLPTLFFAVGIGFIAGLTFDAVYRKLSKVDVVNIEAISSVGA